eukprot:14718580-Alexandrium_andersonii.AAC.1
MHATSGIRGPGNRRKMSRHMHGPRTGNLGTCPRPSLLEQSRRPGPTWNEDCTHQTAHYTSTT